MDRIKLTCSHTEQSNCSLCRIRGQVDRLWDAVASDILAGNTVKMALVPNKSNKNNTCLTRPVATLGCL